MRLPADRCRTPARADTRPITPAAPASGQRTADSGQRTVREPVTKVIDYARDGDAIVERRPDLALRFTSRVGLGLGSDVGGEPLQRHA